VGLDPTVTNVRVFPLLDVSREELANVVGGKVARIEPVDGGLTNTIHKVTRESGEVFGVKHYAGGRDWFDTELTTLTLLHGTLPVPEIVHVDDKKLAIVYRWIEGITLHELRKQGNKDAFSGLAEPLGRVLAMVSQSDAIEPFDLTSILEKTYAQLADGWAAKRMGRPLAEALRKELEAAEPAMAFGMVCLSHGDLGHRNVLVHHSGARWRINGIIDWETTTTGSPLFDIGSFFRYADRVDHGFRIAFEDGYRDAGGRLPEGWFLTSRLLDSIWLVDVLADDPELPEVHSDMRRLLARLVGDAQAR
jgi:aminoglycoside phosphotransferase (APT) family kinase protein